jgi:phosphoglycerol transferase MdoB-like AlkP superfamily enzyme
MAAPGPGTYRELQRMMGLRPFASGDPAAPLCSAGPRAARRGPNGRSVILLVLESVGMQELEARPDGQWLLPNLRRIAADGFSAPSMYAVGTQTCQALPAYLSGQPAQPFDVLFWREPLPRFQGLPRALARRGYRTAYFHGAGLSFEQKRSFLEMVGVETLHELHDDDPEPRYGWGLSDEEIFARTRRWIGDNRREPYLMILATLSGHHPYELPEDWPRRFLTRTGAELFHETLAYMDHHLGLFYDWYVEEERDRGTYLVVISDHAPLFDNTIAIAEGRPLRFDIPFIVTGPDGPEIESWRSRAPRLASQLDVPSTIGGLVGIHPGPCDQGLDLLGDVWPDGRVIAGAGGRGLDELYLWDGTVRARLERNEDRLEVLGSATGADEVAHVEGLRRFLDLFLPVTLSLMEKDAYAP